MPHYIAEQMITTKYKKTRLVNYRQQRDNLNILETCTFIDCDQYRTNYDGHIDKTHYRLKDATGLLLDGTYHVNCIKKGSARTPLGIIDKFDTYETALKNTLLNKFAIETLNNKL